jgi:hypothetical protein
MLRDFLLREHANLIHQRTRVVKGIPHNTVLLFSYFKLNFVCGTPEIDIYTDAILDFYHQQL